MNSVFLLLFFDLANLSVNNPKSSNLIFTIYLLNFCPRFQSVELKLIVTCMYLSLNVSPPLRAASEFCKLSGLLCSYGLYQVVLSEQLCLYCRGNTSEFSARLVLVDQETGASECILFSQLGKEKVKA